MNDAARLRCDITYTQRNRVQNITMRDDQGAYSSHIGFLSQECVHAHNRKTSLILQFAGLHGVSHRPDMVINFIEHHWSFNAKFLLIPKFASQRNYLIPSDGAEIANVTPIMCLEENIPWNLDFHFHLGIDDSRTKTIDFGAETMSNLLPLQHLSTSQQGTTRVIYEGVS